MPTLPFFKTRPLPNTGDPNSGVGASESPDALVDFRRMAPARRRWGRTIGVYIDSSGVQLALAEHRLQQCRLLEVSKIYVPARITTDPERQEFVADAVQTYLRKHAAFTSDVALAVSGSETVFRSFTLPHMASGDLASAVQFEARKQVPFPLEKCTYDFRTTGTIRRGDVNRLRLSLYAADSEHLETTLAPFGRYGRAVSTIYHGQDVLGYLLRGLPEYRDDQQFTLLNIERTRSELSYYRGANLEFYHILSFGSAMLARKATATSFEYFTESLVTEIQNSLDYYAGQFSTQTSSRVYVYGDLSYTDDLIEFLSTRFEFEFQRFPAHLMPAAKGVATAEETGPVALVAVAAAVATEPLADLLPPSRRAQRRADTLFRRVKMAMAVVLAALGIATYYLWQQQHAAAEQRHQLVNQLSAMQQNSLVETYNNVRRQITTRQQYLDRSQRVPSYLTALLKELSRRTPAAVRLYFVKYDPALTGSNLYLRGAVAAREVPPELILAEFVDRLKISPLFSQVVVARSEKRATETGHSVSFELSLRVPVS